MKRLNYFYRPVLVALSLLFAVSCDDDDEIFIAPSDNTVLDAVLADPNFSTLRDAVVLTNLEATLSNPTVELTVFAPDNDAFEDFLDDNNFNSLGDVPVATLENLLLNHVVAGEVTSSMLTTGYVKTQATNDDGDNLDVFVNIGSQILVNEAAVSQADVQVDNGVIHVMDDVINFSTVLSLAAQNDDFSNLEAAIAQEDGVNFFGLGDMSATFTVLAPSDEAFDNLIDEDPNDGIDDINDVLGLSNLTDILTYHVVSGTALRADDIVDDDDINPVFNNPNSSFSISTASGTPVITDARGRNINIVVTNVTGINGVVHVVDNVLLP